MKLQKFVFCSLLLITLTTLAGCFVPNKFRATFTVSGQGNIFYQFDGELQLIIMGIDPRTRSLTKKEKQKVSKAIARKKGVKSQSYLGGNRWKASLENEIRADAWPLDILGEKTEKSITIPYERKLKLFRVHRDNRKTLRFETIEYSEKAKKNLKSFGYVSRGVLRIKTKGKLLQTSGPKLSKELFGEAYKTKFDWFSDAPLKFTIFLD